MDSNNRNDFRKTKLKELYDFYFNTSQSRKNVIQEIKEDAEVRAAYDYLQQKGLIDYNEQGASGGVMAASAKINAHGIDVIELNLDLR